MVKKSRSYLHPVLQNNFSKKGKKTAFTRDEPLKENGAFRIYLNITDHVFQAQVKEEASCCFYMVSHIDQGQHSQFYEFRWDIEFSHGRAQFYPGYAVIGLKVDEKMVQLMAIFQQFFHRLPQKENLICC